MSFCKEGSQSFSCLIFALRSAIYSLLILHFSRPRLVLQVAYGLRRLGFNDELLLFEVLRDGMSKSRESESKLVSQTLNVSFMVAISEESDMWRGWRVVGCGWTVQQASCLEC